MSSTKRTSPWIVPRCVLGAVVLSFACQEMPERPVVERPSLGTQIYEVICDRVGAQSLNEDLDGMSYRPICHGDGNGNYATQVDRSRLPTFQGEAAHVQALGIAKVEVMGRRRQELIEALDAALADVPVGGRGLHDALRDLLQRMLPLYDDGTLPDVTRSFGRLFSEVEKSTAAHQAIAHIAGFRGYRPYLTALGAIAPTLSYDRLIELTRTGLAPVAPYSDPSDLSSAPGPEHEHLSKLFETLAEKMRTADVAPVADAVHILPNGAASRARSIPEILYVLGSHTDQSLSADGSPFGLVRRDERGIGLPERPLVDADRDGLFDLGEEGAPIGLGGPFISPYEWFDPSAVRRDAAGEALDADNRPLWQTYDGSQSVLAATLRSLHRLASLPAPASGGTPLSNLLLGSVPLFGDRVAPDTSEKTYEANEAGPAHTVRYTGFDLTTSPLFHLAHAAAMAARDPHVADLFAVTERIALEHPNELARVVGALLEVDKIVDSDKYKDLSIPHDTMLWDDLVDVLEEIASVPKLMDEILRSMVDPDAVLQASALPKLLSFKDRMAIDTNNLNGPTLNLTRGGTEDPSTPVDRTQPQVGENRSLFHRMLAMNADTTGVVQCNKDHAVVHALDVPGVGDEDYPDGMNFTEPVAPCQIFRIEDAGAFYVDSLGGLAEIVIRDPNIQNAATDHVQELSSGITGMTIHPTPQALHRWMTYVFTPLGSLVPDTNPENDITRRYMADLLDPPATAACAITPITDVYDQTVVPVRTCTPEQSFWMRWNDTLPAFERFDFPRAARPLARAFARQRKSQLFVKLFNVLYKHWDAGANLVRYEPFLAEVLQTDLLPALHELAKVAADTSVRSLADDAYIDGIRALAETLRTAADPSFAAAHNVTDSVGNATGERSDGSAVAQVTPVRLLVGALREIDPRYDAYQAAHPEEADRHERFRLARSDLVDEFFGIEGAGATARFKNSFVPVATAVIGRLLHDQLTAHCPEVPEKDACAWLDELADDSRDLFGGPVVSEAVALLDAFLSDPNVRDEIEQLVKYLLDPAQPDAFASVVGMAVDLPLSLNDVGSLLRAAAPMLRPAENSAPAYDAVLRLLQRTSSDEIDPERVLPIVFKQLVRPLGPGRPSPLVVLLDVMADVERYDSSESAKLMSPRDSAALVSNVNRLLTDPVRGLEQFYKVVQNALAR